MSRCLGRLPHDPVAVAKAPRLRYSASVEAAVPSILDRSTVVYSPQMIGNDVYPNCTVVGLINAALAMEAIATNGAMAFDANAWMPFYAALAGCDPTPAAIAATDGLMLLDVLRKQGVSGFDIGAVAPLTGDFGMVPLDRVSLAACMAGLGCVYTGIDLYQADLDAEAAGSPWDAAVLSQSGIMVGGHCVVLWDYTGLGDNDTVHIATWGLLQPATWAWVEARIAEAYGILFPVAQAADVDVAALRADNLKWLTG